MTENRWEFKKWLEAVDSEVVRICGVSFYDLPDCCYADWFGKGLSAKQAAKRAYQYAKGEE